MPQINVLISEESFIIKKGLQFILNEIDNYTYSFYNRNISKFNNYLKNQKIDILICNNIFFESNNEAIKKNKITVIIIDAEDKRLSRFFINTFEKDKSVIAKIIQDSGNIKKEREEKTDEISEREISVVKCVAKGMTNKEIADTLFISQHTVVTHRKNITRKLGIKTVSGLTVYAILNNIIDINEVN